MGLDHAELGQGLQLLANGVEPRHARHPDLHQHVGVATDAVAEPHLGDLADAGAILLAAGGGES